MSASQLYFTWLLKLWVEGPLASGRTSDLGPLMGQALLATAAALFGLFGSRVVLVDMNQRFVERLRRRAFDRLLALRLDAVQSRATGDLIARLSGDAGALASYLPTVLKRLVGEGLLIAGAICLMFVIDWKIALFVFVLIPVCGVLIGATGRALRQRSIEAQARTGELASLLTEQLHGISTVKIHQAEEAESARFAGKSEAVRRQIVHSELLATGLIGAVFVTTGLGLLAIIWLGTQHFAAAAITHASLLAFTIYGAQIVEPVRRLAEVHTILQQSLASAERVYEIIDDPRVERSGPSRPARQTAECGAALALDDVTLDYGPAARALDGITLRVAPGEQIALAGASGSGKTSLARLLVGFADSSGGGVAIDGVPLHAMPVADLRSVVCVVEQDPFLFSGTLHENIRYGEAGADDDVVRHARHLAGLGPDHGFAPLERDIELAEGGRDLSGGERQRVALARAILRDPALLVLDEATSALDGETEAAIMERMAPWLARRTVVCISHRLSTVARFPRVVVLERGKIVGDGDVESLLEGNDTFRELFRDQAAGRSLPRLQLVTGSADVDRDYNPTTA